MSSQQATSTSALDNVDAEIGRRVHQLLWDRHITQIAFGELSGMDQTAVAKRLRGKLGWNATQVKRAADALHTTVAYLYGETANPERPGSPTSGATISGV